MLISRSALSQFVLLLLAPLAFAGEHEPSEAERLYRSYEELNTDANLAITFYGGEPPLFVQRQAQILQAMANRPAKEAVPVLTTITREYLERIDRMGPERFRASPLLALQLPLIQTLGRLARQPEALSPLEAMAKDPLIKEYARGHALGILAMERLKAIRPASDRTGERRRQLLCDTLLGGLSLPQLLHAPTRLIELGECVLWAVGADPRAAAQFIGTGADTPPRRYAADCAIVAAIAQKEGEGTPLDEREKALLKEVATRYVTAFLPEVAKAPYASRYLENGLIELGTHKGNEAIAGLLSDYGLGRIEPPKPPEEVPKEAPAPIEARDAVAALLAEAVGAMKKNEEADAERLLAQLGARAALPVLQDILFNPGTDRATRAAVLRALAHNGSEQAAYSLLSVARHTDDTKRLEPVVFALTEVKNPAAVPALLEAVFDGTNARLGGACTQVIARLPGAEKARALLKAHADGDFEAVPLLVALAKDWKSERGPYAGLAGLASLDMPEAAEALFGLLGEPAFRDSPDRLAEVRRALSMSIGGHANTPEILSIAIDHLKSLSPTARLAAAQSLATVEGDVTVRRALEEAADAEKDPGVARTLKSLLRERPKTTPPPPPPPVK